MQMDFGLLVLNEADVEAAISNLTSKGIKVLAQYPGSRFLITVSDPVHPVMNGMIRPSFLLFSAAGMAVLCFEWELIGGL